ncbi:MAG: AAA domain-containing protein, partial [Methylophilaceae bacterium]|nr:AAA domain-containing protein [Methylophilaceae bacterium]
PKPPNQKKSRPKDQQKEENKELANLKARQSQLDAQRKLREEARALPRYSYRWFCALLEIECALRPNTEAPEDRDSTISMSFYKVEQDSQSPEIIILKDSPRPIQQHIEKHSDVPVILGFGNGDKKEIRIESFEVKQFSLHCKLLNEEELYGIDLSTVLEAHITIASPSFLWQALLDRFKELKLDNEFDMQENLTPNIEFVFGPPGTGKTAHLAENILIPMMLDAAEKEGRKKVLVLTPTNKAADVLTTRIMDIMEQKGTDNPNAYRDWLVRFGTSDNNRIKQADILSDRSSNNIGASLYSVTVTTAARFFYDGFRVNEYGGSKKLYEMEWDAIAIDEASMIPL